jgi:23S rRNA (guanine2445-N2)-methyltransferase / 23S rRNA (guanine2069-N7)-methyltransferase
VTEGQARLLVNLTDYLDTGLFLDHRKVRMHIGDSTRGSRFLNLFCYTGAATVHAALGGARYTTSVDLSATYLDWARKNFAANGLSEQRHRLERADALTWLEENEQKFDLIFVDPPTFSNSKRTDADFDIQRDHIRLLEACADHLTDTGLIIFSNNRHKFELASELQGTFKIEDRTAWSRDPDFERARHKRHCWFLQAVLPRPQRRSRPTLARKPATPWANAVVRKTQTQ